MNIGQNVPWGSDLKYVLLTSSGWCRRYAVWPKYVRMMHGYKRPKQESCTEGRKGRERA